jgi:hypothetical protein
LADIVIVSIFFPFNHSANDLSENYFNFQNNVNLGHALTMVSIRPIDCSGNGDIFRSGRVSTHYDTDDVYPKDGNEVWGDEGSG